MVIKDAYHVIKEAAEEAYRAYPTSASAAFGFSIAARLGNHEQLSEDSLIKAIHLLTPLCPTKRAQLGSLLSNLTS